MIQVVHPESRIQGSKRHRIPDPGVKKAPDPRSGSATLVLCLDGYCQKQVRISLKEMPVNKEEKTEMKCPN
jgi:hypothetical protein